MSTTPDHYRCLAAAVAGRRVSVRGAGDGYPLAYCDGLAIVLPRRLSGDYGDAWLDVVAQSLLLAADSLSLSILRRLIGHPQAARRYAYLEIRRVLRDMEWRAPHAFAVHPALTAALGAMAMTRTAGRSADYALQLRHPLPDIPDFVGSVRPLIALRYQWSREEPSAPGSKQQPGQFEPERNPPPEPEEDAATETSTILKLFENSFMGRNPISDMLMKILGAGPSAGNREDSADPGGGSEMPVALIERAWRRGVNAVRALLPDLAGLESATSSQFIYPEWDEFKQAYRPDWVHVEEVDPWRRDDAAELTGVLTAAPRELRRQLSALGLDFEMHRRELDGTEFDVGRLIEYAIDLRLGHTSTTDIYRASRRTRRDLGVMVLVDSSGSTKETNAEGESVFEHQLRAAWHLAQTFDRLGDCVALYGFQSWGRKLMRMIRLKGSEEHWGGRVAERFRLLEPAGYTRTGAAIRHGASLLRASMRLPNRLLILITDGFSYDQDYENEYAMSDSRRALAEARAEGTGCVCLCIGGSTGAAQLQNVFGSANLLMVDDTKQMVRHMRKVCSDALHSVSKRGVGPVRPCS